jgi:lipopolysaccharide heptosyltransferase II
MKASNVNNILVVNVNWLGDAVFSTPVFKALKKAHPQARISCLAVPRVKDVLQYCPFIDEIIVYDEKGKHWYPWEKLKLILELRRQKFDAVLLLHRSATRALLTYLAGIPVRVGYGIKKSSLFLTHRVSPDGNIHRLDEYGKLVGELGIAPEDTYELDIPAGESKNMEELLARHGIDAKDYLVVVNAGGNWDLKRWPYERFSQLIARLVRNFRVKVVIPGADKDIDLAQSIARLSGVDPVVLAGSTGLKALMALFKRADCVISNDTGPLHLAASLGTDVIALFGPTRPEITGPRGRGRSFVLHKEIGCNKAPCYHLSCSFNECLHAITVDDVCEAFQTIRSS